MQILELLQLQRDIYDGAGENESPELLAALKEDAASYLPGDLPQVYELYSLNATHELVAFGGKEYLVWDRCLNQIMSLLDQCVFGVLSSKFEPFNQHQEQIEETARNVSRQIFCSYFAGKLKPKMPYAAAAFAMIADDLSSEWQMPFKGHIAILMRDVILMQRMLMFHHEMVHLYFHRRPSRLTEFKSEFAELLLHTHGLLENEPEIKSICPEFSKEMSDNLPKIPLMDLFLEELGCDYQSFIVGGRTITESRPPQSWLEGLSRLYLASHMLAFTERLLKIGATAWLEIAGETEELTDLDKIKSKIEQGRGRMHLPTLQLNRPVFNVRQSATFFGLERILAKAERQIGLDLTSAINQIMSSYHHVKQVWSKTILEQFHHCFSPEILAKVVARSTYARNKIGLSREEAASTADRILRNIHGANAST